MNLMRDNVLLSQRLKSTVQLALVKKFLQGNERPCDKNDFLETKDNLEKLTLDINQMFESLVTYYFSNKSCNEFQVCHNNKDIDNDTLTLLLILCGQNNSNKPWNTEATIKNCALIFSQVLKFLNCKDSSDLFSSNCRINLLKYVLQILCSDLTASTWKHFPASVACYNWILKMIKQPELSQYLALVLPPALLLTDDFVMENRITGIQCLNYIIHNITIAELQLYGQGEVIYSALIPILRTREADLIQLTIFPLMFLANKLEFNLGRKHPTKWSRFDNILEIYLESMELEQTIHLRNCYVKNLRMLITDMGYSVIRWSKRLLRIFDEYIKTAGKYNDETTIHHCVKTIEKFIELSEKGILLSKKHLLFILQVALCSIINFKNGTQIETLEIIVGCIKKLLNSFTEFEREEFKKDFINNFSGSLNCKKFYTKMYEILKANK